MWAAGHSQAPSWGWQRSIETLDEPRTGEKEKRQRELEEAAAVPALAENYVHLASYAHVVALHPLARSALLD